MRNTLLFSWLSVAALTAAGRPQQANITPQVRSKATADSKITEITLEPHFVTTIRVAEPVNQSRNSAASRRWWTWEQVIQLVLLGILYLMPGLGQIALFDRDEPRFATAARSTAPATVDESRGGESRRNPRSGGSPSPGCRDWCSSGSAWPPLQP